MVQEAETRYKGRQEVTHYNNRSVCAAERETRDGFGSNRVKCGHSSLVNVLFVPC